MYIYNRTQDLFVETFVDTWNWLGYIDNESLKYKILFSNVSNSCNFVSFKKILIYNNNKMLVHKIYYLLLMG